MVLTMILALAFTAAIGSALPKPLYLAFGGSNTCGHYTPRHKIYFKLLTDALRERGLVSNGVNLCISAMGPQYSAACLDSLVPAGSAFATVEYLPNMIAGDVDAERSAYDTLVHGLLARGVRVAIIQLIPSRLELAKAQRRTRQRLKLNVTENTDVSEDEVATYDSIVARTHSRTLELAARLDLPVVVLNMASQAYFFRDFHLNTPGHAAVTSAVFKHFSSNATLVVAGSTSPLLAPHIKKPSADGVSCAVGKQLAREVLSTTGFAQVDLSNGKSSTHTAKIAWESRAPNARLVLCARLVDRVGSGTILIGFQKSHMRNMPVVGIADLSCHGCNCTLRASAKQDDCDATAGQPLGARRCTYDLLHRQTTTETVFVELVAHVERPVAVGPSAECGCQVHIAVAPHPSRQRVIVRAAIVADSRYADFVRLAVVRYGHLKQGGGRRRFM